MNGNSRSKRAHLLALIGPLSLLLVCTLAHGDAASGTYTGSVAARGNYYWERSTRVVAPSVAASVATPVGVRVEGSYLLDAITSASLATGVGDQNDSAFTEKRNEVQAGVGYELDLGATQLDLSVRGRFSKEPDYVSRGVGFGSALSLDQRNTVLHLTGYFIEDDVFRKVRMPGVSRTKAGDLRALSLGLGWDQVLSRATTFTLGYDLALLDGFLANPYRMVRFADGGAAPERHPDSRVRHAGYVWAAHFFDATRTALRLGYRLYYDSWEILAHAPEVRVHQEIGPHVELRLRYRYYTQTGSSFYRPSGNLRADPYITSDPKMSEFHDQTLGLKVRLSLDFLGFTAFDVLRTAVLDWTVEYVFNTNLYGNGVIAQGGLGWTF